MTWRDLRKAVKRAGGVLVRKNPNEVYHLPDGSTVTIQTRHLSDQVRGAVLKAILKRLANQ